MSKELKYVSQGLVFFICKDGNFYCYDWSMVATVGSNSIKLVKGLLSKAPWQLLSVLSSGANSRKGSHAAKFLCDTHEIKAAFSGI